MDGWISIEIKSRNWPLTQNLLFEVKLLIESRVNRKCNSLLFISVLIDIMKRSRKQHLMLHFLLLLSLIVAFGFAGKQNEAIISTRSLREGGAETVYINHLRPETRYAGVDPEKVNVFLSSELSLQRPQPPISRDYARSVERGEKKEERLSESAALTDRFS